MKTIILAASIFYILGVKFSNNIDLPAETQPADSVIFLKTIPMEPVKAETSNGLQGSPFSSDSLKIPGTTEEGASST